MRVIKAYFVEWVEYLNNDPEDFRTGVYKNLGPFKSLPKATKCYWQKKESKYISNGKPVCQIVCVRDNCGKHFHPGARKSQVNK